MAFAVVDFDSLWDYARPAETEAKFVALRSEVAGDPEGAAQLETQIARTLGLQRKFQEAHALLDKVEASARKLPVAEVRYLLERGRVFRSSGAPDKAAPFFREAFQKAKKRKIDSHAVDAAHMIAILEKPEESIRWNRRALAMAERSKDPVARKWLASLYNNLGWTHFELGKFEEALALFRKALAEREKGKNARAIREARWAVAKAQRKLGRYTEALKEQLALESACEEAGEVDGYVFEELAEIYLATKEPVLARKYFRLAYEELRKDPWFVESEPERLARLQREGEGS